MNGALARGLEVLAASGKLAHEEVAKLGRFLAEAEEEALFRMSPIQYAQTQGISERDAIDLFLHATHAGLMEFTWGLMCPACKAFLSTPAALRSLAKRRSCNLCDLEVAPTDDALEVAFTVSPAVRRIRFHDLSMVDYRRDWARIYFSASNVLSPEVRELAEQCVVWSDELPQGETRTFSGELQAGTYGVVAPFSHVWTWIAVEPGAGARELEMDVLSGETIPAAARLEPGPVTVRLHNRSGAPLILGLCASLPKETVLRGRTLRPFLSGKRLVTSQAFRELFRTQSIPSGGGLEFKRLTVLFTDLKESTELYERIGDVQAYALVRQHFDLLREVIDRSGGAMVKTIGDAIMASFADVEPAMEAAAAMRTAIRRLGEGQLQLKVGVHAGPCIAVELNEQLDYFGHTVNVAARVQGLADGGEIVCTEEVWNVPGVQDRIRAAGLREHRQSAHLKGVAEDVTVYRLRAQ